jgi:hypothetical protein
MVALLAALALAVPQDSDKLKSFSKKADSDGKSDRRSHSGDRTKDRQEHLPGPPGGSEPASSQVEYESSDAENEIARILLYPLYAPIVYIVEDRGRRFGWFPYFDDKPYYLDQGRKTLALQFSSSAGRIDSGVRSLNFEGVMSWASSCDLRFDIQEFQEEVEGGTDRLELQQYQLNFSLTPGAGDVNFSLGLGVAALDGDLASETGFTTQANLLWFPAKPFSLRLYAGHILFEDASVGDLRLEAGIHFHRFVLTAGMRSLITEGEDLTGPTLGISVFF